MRIRWSSQQPSKNSWPAISNQCQQKLLAKVHLGHQDHKDLAEDKDLRGQWEDKDLRGQQEGKGPLGVKDQQEGKDPLEDKAQREGKEDRTPDAE